MNDQDRKNMALYEITSETKTIYKYKQYRYENLRDALYFAEMDVKRKAQALILNTASSLPSI